MILKEKLNVEPGFQYVIDALEFMSAPGRSRLLQQPFMTNPKDIEQELDNTTLIIDCLRNSAMSRQVTIIRHQLMQMHDLQGTLNNLHKTLTIEEIELFELKNFAFLCITTSKAAHEMGIGHILNIPDLSPVFRLLDPDDTKIPNFYIYDSYHPDLPDLRKQLKTIQSRLENLPDKDPARIELQSTFNELFECQNIIQNQVIQQLSEELHPYWATLQEAHDRMAYTDLLFAKATLADNWQLSRPSIQQSQPASQTSQTTIRQMWNPRLKHRTEELGQRYQPIDVDLHHGVCLITGANMAGKTVMLKTVAIIQLLAQFGFYVPAAEASLCQVDDIILCIGDEQNEMNGLSSFASEIIKISDSVTRSASGRYLILIDEPARTTNPIEGKAIVQALATILDRHNSFTLITTHYSQLGLPCRRLRVKGFVESLADIPLSPDNINRFMDYSLLPDNSDDVPQEALRIAAILQCNPALLQTAHNFLSGTN